MISAMLPDMYGDQKWVYTDASASNSRLMDRRATVDHSGKKEPAAWCLAFLGHKTLGRNLRHASIAMRPRVQVAK